MNTKLKLMSAVLAVTGLTAAGAMAQAMDNTPNTNPPAERAADNAGQAANNAGQAMENAADATGNAVENAADATGNAAKDAGKGVKATAGEDEDAKGVLETSTEAAVTDNGFNDLVERFVDADRNRIGASEPTADQLDKLNKVAANVRQAWQQKYGSEFDINQRNTVFNDSYTVRYGEVGENGQARTAGNAIPPTAGENPTSPMPNLGEVNGTDRTAPDAGTATPPVASNNPNANREPGRDIATISVPKMGDLKAMQIPLIYEFPGVWKIDAPDSLNGKDLADSLTKNLQAVYDGRAQWPADEQAAYRAVSDRVLNAIFNAGGEKADAPQAGQGNGR